MYVLTLNIGIMRVGLRVCARASPFNARPTRSLLCRFLFFLQVSAKRQKTWVLVDGKFLIISSWYSPTLPFQHSDGPTHGLAFQFRTEKKKKHWAYAIYMRKVPSKSLDRRGAAVWEQTLHGPLYHYVFEAITAQHPSCKLCPCDCGLWKHKMNFLQCGDCDRSHNCLEQTIVVGKEMLYRQRSRKRY